MAIALCNPTNDATVPTQSSLCQPRGLAVDSAGNLYVADTVNGRVCFRFPAPFAHQGQQQADLVLGQHDFSGSIPDPTSRTMKFPYGLAHSGKRTALAVSDAGDNRVLFFKFTGNGTLPLEPTTGSPPPRFSASRISPRSSAAAPDTQMNSPPPPLRR